MTDLFSEKINKIIINEDSEVIKCLKHSTGKFFQGAAKLYYPTIEPNKFIPVLGLDLQNNIIENSNSYFVDDGFKQSCFNNIKEYNNIHKIYTGIEAARQFLIEANNFEVIDEPSFLMFNPFSGVNFGHDLSIIFHRIKLYKDTQQTSTILLCENMEALPFTLNICKILLPQSKFLILKSNVSYKFTDIFITPNIVFNINLHPELHRSIQDIIIQNTVDIQKYKDRKICLIKNSSNQNNIVSKCTSFSGIKILNILNDKYNYVVINPEKMNYDEIILYLTFASKILVSFGAIMYGHGIFFNKSAKLYFINKSNYLPYYDIERYKFIKIFDSNLDNNIDSFIEQIDECV